MLTSNTWIELLLLSSLASSKVLSTNDSQDLDAYFAEVLSKVDLYLEESFSERALSSAYTASRLSQNLETFIGNRTRFDVNDAFSFILDQIGAINNADFDRSGRSLISDVTDGFLSFTRINARLESNKMSRSGGGYGGGGGYGSGYIDPYVVLGALGLGTFLFNIIYNILNSSARSVDVDDLSVPLYLSDVPDSVPELLSNAFEKYEVDPKEPHSYPARLEDLYIFIEEAKAAYELSFKKPECLKNFACRLMVGLDMIGTRNTGSMAELALDIVLSGLGKVFKDKTVLTMAKEARKSRSLSNFLFCKNILSSCKLESEIM
ncbi:uncharacterized protein LOC136034113 isoform X2 [Artemia franciscana]|uniref:uncharacterized protein LOC136034113 isoform X2 n=1 Tax=Artemia franciscana TaxID=6661 RepID=UPI0032DBC044